MDHYVPMPSRSRFLWWAGPRLVRGVGKAFFSMSIDREAALPPPPFVMAANHFSHFDPPVVGAAMGVPIRFLALDDLFGPNRFFDWLIIGFGAIATPRHRRPTAAVRAALASLEAGEPVGVFPEGRRVGHWGEHSLKRGAAWLSLRARVPLVPAAIIGTDEVFGMENRLHRGRIRVVLGEAIEPEDDDSVELTERWAEWMSSHLGPPVSSH